MFGDYEFKSSLPSHESFMASRSPASTGGGGSGWQELIGPAAQILGGVLFGRDRQYDKRAEEEARRRRENQLFNAAIQSKWSGLTGAGPGRADLSESESYRSRYLDRSDALRDQRHAQIMSMLFGQKEPKLDDEGKVIGAEFAPGYTTKLLQTIFGG